MIKFNHLFLDYKYQSKLILIYLTSQLQYNLSCNTIISVASQLQYNQCLFIYCLPLSTRNDEASRTIKYIAVWLEESLLASGLVQRTHGKVGCFINSTEFPTCFRGSWRESWNNRATWVNSVLLLQIAKNCIIWGQLETICGALKLS